MCLLILLEEFISGEISKTENIRSQLKLLIHSGIQKMIG